ncbi:target of Nesh-SH3-like isoform X16 [Hemiscyllium ocellatum]|uniref:target of Nesh-SH3-like isoform X16 n=1 Tax=Hemiscyllium ocellatum TaxID=170820 RepID=UPI0029677643|nr:target of Nesh-SH3-like isoform X16 [Hemiscyllium ocellatum]
MSLKFLFVIFGGIVLTLVDNARTLPRVKRQSLKVRITAKDDSIIIKYLSSNPATFRLQGYILGYGGRQSKQNITLPDNGDPFEVDVEFNPRYLIAVHPVAEQSKTALKKCKGNLNHQKPPQITISTRTATSVFLTWTNGIKGNVYKHGGHDCGDERHYTVRYREKERDKKWLYQCCPTSATTIDNLKPNTVYEFGVRVSKAKEEGTWSEPTNYITAVTSSPPSTGNGQTQKISKKLAINFGNENGKNARIAELPGETNIIGIKDKKGPVASYPAQNGTNWIRFPKKPTVNTHVVLGGPSASDSARDHSTSSSSPKPHIPHQPERAPDHLHGKEGRNKLKSKETSNTVTKPSLKSGKMRNTKEKSKVKPLTTKESKLPSSVSPSFPSKPVPKSDPAEIQIPIFLTPSPPSHLDTTDKQQPTEPVTTPPSTTLPFTILSTTSGHTAVDKQHLPGTTSALDPMETQKFSEPEIPSSSRGSFHPTSDPDAMNNQEFKEPEFPSATSSFSSTSNLASKLDVTDAEQFTEYEEPFTKDSFSLTASEPDKMDNQQFPEYGILTSIISNIITLRTTSESDAMANQEFTEPEIHPTVDSSATTSKKSDEFDSTQRKQISVPESEAPFSSTTPVNNLKTSKHDAMDTQQSKADHEVPNSDISKVFSFLPDYELPVTASSHVINPIPDSEAAKIGQKEVTDPVVPTFDTPNAFSSNSDYGLLLTDSPHAFNSSPDSDPAKRKEKEITDHNVPTPATPNVFSLTSEYKLLTTDTPNVFKSIPESEPAEIAEKEMKADHEVPTSDTRNVFTLISDHELPITGSPYMFNSVSESDPAKIGEDEFTEGHKMPTPDTGNVFSPVSHNELPVTDSPYLISPIPEPEPTMIGKDEFTADHEVPTSDTRNVFSSISEFELPVIDSPYIISSIPEPEPTEIGKDELKDHVPAPDTSSVFSLISESKPLATDIPSVFKTTLDSEPARTAWKKVTADHEVPTSDTRSGFSSVSTYELPVTDYPYVLHPVPGSEPAKIGKDQFTDHHVPTRDAPSVFSLITKYYLKVTDTPKVFKPIPESETTEIAEKEVTAAHEVQTSDIRNVVSSISDNELLVTDSPYAFHSVPGSDPAKIRKNEFTDHEVPTSNTRNVFSSIPESERAKIGKKEVTADYEVPISYTRYGFSSTSDNEPLVTDTPNVFNPIPQPKTAKIGTNEDFGFSTSDTAIMPSPSPIYETGEKELTGLKLPTSEISHEFIPTSVSELDLDKKFPDNKLTHPDSSHVFIPTLGNIEDTEFTVRKLPKSDTPRKFSSTPVSELDNKEDEEFTEHKLPTSGTPDVLIQSQESALDKVEDKDFTEYLFPTSDTPHVRSSTSVQPPFDSNGKMLTESDPPSDRSPIITSKRVQKPDMKQKFPELETQSPGGHLSSTVPGNTQESSPVFRSTPVSNIDGQGQERFRGTYVKYLTKQDRPCSITESLKHFPHENITNNKATAPPRYPPSNLTLVTVEGCPTFLIVDWESNENDTASEYEVVSTMQSMDNKTEELITVTNQTHTAVENLKPNTSYTFSVTATNIHGKGPSSVQRSFVTESADPSVSEYVPGKDAIWTQYSFKFDSYSECQGKQFVKRTRYRKFVGIILCNSLRYKIYLSNSLSGIFYNIGDLSGHGEDHCQFVDSFLDGRTGEHLLPEQLPIRQGFYRSVRQEPVMFGTIGGRTHINYVHWYECGIAIPGQW